MSVKINVGTTVERVKVSVDTVRDVVQINVVSAGSTTSTTPAINRAFRLLSNEQSVLYTDGAIRFSAEGDYVQLPAPDEAKIGFACIFYGFDSGATCGFYAVEGNIIEWPDGTMLNYYDVPANTRGMVQLDDTGNWKATLLEGSDYTLPVATDTVLGGIKSSGDILVDGGGVATVATGAADGNIPRLGNNILEIGSGTINFNLGVSISTYQSEIVLGNGGSIYTGVDGYIFTVGTGTINFGDDGTRTVITGTATTNQSIAFPDASGTLALTSDIPSISGLLTASNNLSDLSSASTARTNLGLGTLATQSGTFSGTSSGTNTGDQDLSGYQTKAGTLALGGFSSITGAISGSNVSGGTLGATAGTNLTGTAASLTAGLVTSIGNLAGDVTSSNRTTTLATVNPNVGSFGSATQSAVQTVNAKGLTTAISNVTITPAVGSITGLGTGVGTALAAATNGTGGFVTVDGTATLTNKTLTSPIVSNLTASKLVLSDASKILVSPTLAQIQTAMSVLVKASTAQIDKTSSASFTDVTGLTGFVLEAATNYKLEIFGTVTCGASGGYAVLLLSDNNLALTSAGNTGDGIMVQIGASYGSMYRYDGVGVSLNAKTAAGTSAPFNSTFYFKTGASVPTVKIQFAQSVSNGTTSSLLTGCICSISKIA